MKFPLPRGAALAVLVLLAALSAAGPALAVDVTFQVRMGRQMQLGAFDPTLDFVDLAGSFNGWGSAPLTPLSDADGDSIHTVTLGGFTAGQTVEFKFRINGLWDGTEEFPGVGNNRVLTVQPDSNEILVWYGDLPPLPTGGELHWWNDTVFYEIFVRSFYDSDGDGIGDLPGLTSRLDYLNDGDPATETDLGITGIWLMPINDSPSYHGYDAVDYRAIDPDYGTLADFEAFLAAAHARGIKVIVDYVMNHCSSQHPWFTAAAGGNPQYRDWFRWSATDPGQTGPWGQDVWHWNASGWYYGLFWGGMPDLNHDNPAVKQEMFDTAAWWLETVGVDGFRLDAVLYIDEDGDQLQDTAGTLQFWQDFNARVKAVQPAALSVGEAWTASSTAAQYVADQRLDLCFEFDLSYATVGAAGGGDAAFLSGKIAQVCSLYPFLQFATFLTNHDQDRVLNALGFDLDRAKAAAGIYLTLPGVPFVYYGEEVGLIGAGPDQNKRSPMQWTDGAQAGFTIAEPWQPLNDNYRQFNVLVEDEDPTSLLSWYRQLIHLRNRTPALRRGAHLPLTSSAAPVLGFLRSDGAQTVLCLANTTGTPQNSFTLTGAAGGPVPGSHTLTNLLAPGGSREIAITAAGEITGLDLAPWQVAVYAFPGASAAEPTDGPLPGYGLHLEQNRPNPFNPSTTIRYRLPAPARVRVGVYDLAGREVALLLDQVQAEGAQELDWNGADGRGRPVGAGVYLLRVDAGGATRQAKMMLLK